MIKYTISILQLILIERHFSLEATLFKLLSNKYIYIDSFSLESLERLEIPDERKLFLSLLRRDCCFKNWASNDSSRKTRGTIVVRSGRSWPRRGGITPRGNRLERDRGGGVHLPAGSLK